MCQSEAISHELGKYGALGGLSVQKKGIGQYSRMFRRAARILSAQSIPAPLQCTLQQPIQCWILAERCRKIHTMNRDN